MMSVFMRTLLGGLLSLGGFAGNVRADDPSGVLVETMAPHRERVPVHEWAYGSVMPEGSSMISLVQPLDGWVRQLDSTPGQSLRAGDPVLEWSAAATIASAFEQAASAVKLSEAQLQHTRTLLGQHLATQDQVDQAIKAVSDAQANYDALKSEGGDRRTIIIKAPVDGVVTAIPVMQGHRVAAGTPLALFAPVGGLVATVGLEPASVAAVHVGAVVVVKALNSNVETQGHVIRVDSAVDPVSRLVNADIAFGGDAAQPAALKTGALMNGTDVSAMITTGMAEGWAVSHDAIQYDTKGRYVMQAAGQHAVRVGVSMRHEGGDTDIVDGAIDPARPVITSGSYQLSDGDAIRFAPDAPITHGVLP